MGGENGSPGLYIVNAVVLKGVGISLSSPCPWNGWDDGIRAASCPSAVDANTMSAGDVNGFGTNDVFSIPAFPGGGVKNGLGHKLKRNMAKSVKLLMASVQYQSSFLRFF